MDEINLGNELFSNELDDVNCCLSFFHPSIQFLSQCHITNLKHNFRKYQQNLSHFTLSVEIQLKENVCGFLGFYCISFFHKQNKKAQQNLSIYFSQGHVVFLQYIETYVVMHSFLQGCNYSHYQTTGFVHPSFLLLHCNFAILFSRKYFKDKVRREKSFCRDVIKAFLGLFCNINVLYGHFVEEVII